MRYGRCLFEAGWPYSHYSKVINAIAAKEPLLRRSLQPSWDLAFSWMREEPRENHIGMPWQLLLASIATDLVWGWPRVAGILDLTWGGLLRKAFAAKRPDLLLPGDVQGACDYALLSVGEPKTRYKAARHQSAKIDQPDLFRVVSLAFGSLGFSQKLWLQSSSIFRSRFDLLMQRLDVSVLPCNKSRKLDLGSLRAGGATWLRQSLKMPNWYADEADVETPDYGNLFKKSPLFSLCTVCPSKPRQSCFLLVTEPRITGRAHPSKKKTKLFSLLQAFGTIVARAEQLVLIRTPTSAWFTLFSVG